MNSSSPSIPQPLRAGKVREIYAAGNNFIIVASDRISAFDCILPTPIPEKGRVLSTLSAWWFARTQNIVPNHLLSSDIKEFPEPFTNHDEWRGRAMLVKRAEVLPVECVVRGYLAGSGWKEYQRSQSVCGENLPAGLQESSQLPHPIFTPTTKAEIGDHDAPIDFARTEEILGAEMAARVREISLRLYQFASDLARERGLILADTKFEFGVVDGELTLVDEIFTPDSSRFWDAEDYAPGRAQNSFDKQFVRDYLEALDWDKTPPAPTLPSTIVLQTQSKYFAAYERITGQTWQS